MNHLYHFFFNFHLLFGYIALLSALGALLAKKGRMIHRYCGKAFVLSMGFIFITTIPMAIIKGMYLPFLITIIALYFTLSGFNYARTADRPGRIRVAITIIMLCVGMITTCIAIYSYYLLPAFLIPMATFTLGGLSCTILCLADLKIFYYRQQIPNSVRIMKHFTAMLAALAVSVTGFTVVNLSTIPAFFTWLGPGLITILFIRWWRIRLMRRSQISTHIK